MKKKRYFLFLVFQIIFLNSLFAQKFAEHPHPFYYTKKKIATAKANIQKYEWAKHIFEEALQSADEAAAKSDDNLRAWFSEFTPISQCDCPYCGHHWQDYTWHWTKEKPDQLQCNYCNNITSVEHFRENDTFNVIDPQGTIHPHPVYRDSTGKVHPIRQLIFFQKNAYAYQWIKNLGIAYAVTGKEKYAKKAVVLLKRLAEVYPGFGIHDNFRFEPDPFGWAGKLRMWHYTDAYTLQNCAATYDAIYHSKALNKKDKAFIESNLFQAGLDFLTAVQPTQGISNDIAFRYAGVVMLGRTLESHDAIAWALDPNEGYPAFVDKLFYEDGTWHERAPGYHNMAMRPLPTIVELLHGYSDPPSYRETDRFDDINLKDNQKLGRIFSVLLDMRFPDGTIPPVNDGRMGVKPNPMPLEAIYNWTGDEDWLEKANQAHQGKLLENGDLYALFNRNPNIDQKMNSIQTDVVIPEISKRFDGMGLSMLRRGKGADQIVFTLHHHKYTSPHTHYDALSTILFANGREMLSDFGYPSFSTMLRINWYLKTLSHNTLTVDTNNQYAPYSVANWIHHGDLFSACEAEAWEAYRFTCEPYFRQIALVDGEGGHIYAVDIFRGEGGSAHDFALHGEGDTLTLGALNAISTEMMEGNDYAYDQLNDIHVAKTSVPWNAEWTWADGISLYCHFADLPNCEIYKALTPGERLKSMKDRKKFSLFNRRKGENLRSEFVGIYEPNSDKRIIQKIEKIYVSEDRDWAVVLKVHMPNSTHYILSSYLNLAAQKTVFSDDDIEIIWKSRFGIVSVKDGKIVDQEWVKGVMEGLRHGL